VVHNGIIENFLVLKAQQQAQGYRFTSDTDTVTDGLWLFKDFLLHVMCIITF
jgi:glutamine phosphoribosylpyrophosphate amidotransferase